MYIKRFRFVFTGRKKNSGKKIKTFKLNIPATDKAYALFFINRNYEDVNIISE